jgi:hypothetical protein
VCTGHCTVQCPVHRQPRAQNPFSCALFGGSPDSYCALSSVHRTGTVDCPVRPYHVLKKSPPARSQARGFSVPLFSLSLAISTPSPVTTPLRRSLHRRRPSASPLPSLVSIPFSLFPPFSLSSCHQRSSSLFTLLCPIQNPVNSSESKWCNVFLCAHCVSLQVSSSLGRVSQPLIAISPKP